MFFGQSSSLVVSSLSPNFETRTLFHGRLTLSSLERRPEVPGLPYVGENRSPHNDAPAIYRVTSKHKCTIKCVRVSPAVYPRLCARPDTASRRARDIDKAWGNRRKSLERPAMFVGDRMMASTSLAGAAAVFPACTATKCTSVTDRQMDRRTLTS